MTFAGEDFRVVTADSAGRCPLAKLKSENPSLVLSGHHVCRARNGYDLCTAIKRDSPGLPVLLLSSKLSPYDKSRGQAANANDFIDKPFDTQKADRQSQTPCFLVRRERCRDRRNRRLRPYRSPAALNATLVGARRAAAASASCQASHGDASPLSSTYELEVDSGLFGEADSVTRPTSSGSTG